jgi:hypothetical protein
VLPWLLDLAAGLVDRQIFYLKTLQVRKASTLFLVIYR